MLSNEKSMATTILFLERQIPIKSSKRRVRPGNKLHFFIFVILALQQQKIKTTVDKKLGLAGILKKKTSNKMYTPF